MVTPRVCGGGHPRRSGDDGSLGGTAGRGRFGGQRFAQGVRDRLTDDRQEQRAAERLKRARLDWRGLIAMVEAVKGERWDRLRERHGD